MDQLVQPDNRGNNLEMLDGATKILAAFLSFADKHSSDEAAIQLAYSVTAIADRVATLREAILAKESTWFGTAPGSENISHRLSAAW